jgi:outer membrane protein
MRKLFLSLTLIFCFGIAESNAQKFGYIDTEYITAKMPEYKKVQEEFEKAVSVWTKEISDKLSEIEKLEKTYRAEEILLTDDMRQQKLKVIADKEKDAREFQNKVFGMNGLMNKKKKELMKPVLDEVGKAIEKIARQKSLMFLFDKSADGLSMIYTDPRHDYTDYVMEELGLTPEQLKESAKEEEIKEKDTKAKATAKGKTSKE